MKSRKFTVIIKKSLLIFFNFLFSCSVQDFQIYYLVTKVEHIYMKKIAFTCAFTFKILFQYLKDARQKIVYVCKALKTKYIVKINFRFSDFHNINHINHICQLRFFDFLPIQKRSHIDRTEMLLYRIFITLRYCSLKMNPKKISIFIT